MSAEVKLKPGWFINDVRRASNRVDQWSAQLAKFDKPTPTSEGSREFVETEWQSESVRKRGE